MRLNRYFVLAVVLITPGIVMAAGDTGNRYDLERDYHSDISASSAYVETLAPGRDWQHERKRSRPNPVIIDVRTIEEYVGGHPPAAYNIPYPRIHKRPGDPGYIGQEDEAFVEAVNALDLPKDTLIITMCRTGYRSVGAANVLAEAGYTNVRNMWEGFVGRLKTNTAGDELDLDGDGDVDDDPYSDDRDGWSNFGGLPVSTKLKHPLLYSEYMHLYYSVDGIR